MLQSISAGYENQAKAKGGNASKMGSCLVTILKPSPVSNSEHCSIKTKTKQAATVKLKTAKDSGLTGIRTYNLCHTGVALYKRSYQAT